MIDIISYIGTFLSGAGAWWSYKSQKNETKANEALINAIAQLSNVLYFTKNVHQFYQGFYYKTYKGFANKGASDKQNEWPTIIKTYRTEYIRPISAHIPITSIDAIDFSNTNKELVLNNFNTIESLGINIHLKPFLNDFSLVINYISQINKYLNEIDQMYRAKNRTIDEEKVEITLTTLDELLVAADAALIELIEIQVGVISKIDRIE